MRGYKASRASVARRVHIRNRAEGVRIPVGAKTQRTRSVLYAPSRSPLRRLRRAESNSAASQRSDASGQKRTGVNDANEFARGVRVHGKPDVGPPVLAPSELVHLTAEFEHELKVLDRPELVPAHAPARSEPAHRASQLPLVRPHLADHHRLVEEDHAGRPVALLQLRAALAESGTDLVRGCVGRRRRRGDADGCSGGGQVAARGSVETRGFAMEAGEG